jgi:hypothetical protein
MTTASSMSTSEHVKRDVRHVNINVRHVNINVRLVNINVRLVNINVRHVNVDVRLVDVDVRHVDVDVRHVDVDVRRSHPIASAETFRLRPRRPLTNWISYTCVSAVTLSSDPKRSCLFEITRRYRPSSTFSPQAGRRATNLDVRVRCPSPRLRGEGGPERSEGPGEGILQPRVSKRRDRLPFPNSPLANRAHFLHDMQTKER